MTVQKSWQFVPVFFFYIWSTALTKLLTQPLEWLDFYKGHDILSNIWLPGISSPQLWHCDKQSSAIQGNNTACKVGLYIDAVCDESSYILPFFFEQQCSATISWGTKVSNILYCTTSTGSSRDANCGLSQIFGKWPVWLLLLQPLTAMEWNLLRHPTKLSTTPPLKLHARMNSSKWLMGFASSSTFISSADFASRPKADWLMTHCIWISPSKVKIFVLL